MMRWLIRFFGRFYHQNIDHVNNGGHVLVPFLGVHLVLAVMGGIGWFVLSGFMGTPDNWFAWVPIGFFILIGGLISLLVILDTIKGLIAIFIYKDPRYRLF